MSDEKMRLIVEVEQVEAGEYPKYRVSLTDGQHPEEVPFIEKETFYPEMAAAALLRDLSMRPRMRRSYACPSCGESDGLKTLEHISGLCRVEVDDDGAVSFPDDYTDHGAQYSVGLICTMCGWSKRKDGREYMEYPVDEDWIREQLEVK